MLVQLLHLYTSSDGQEIEFLVFFWQLVLWNTDVNLLAYHFGVGAALWNNKMVYGFCFFDKNSWLIQCGNAGQWISRIKGIFFFSGHINVLCMLRFRVCPFRLN
jgi:hypothetical protein